MNPQAQRITIDIAVHGNAFNGKAHEVPDYLNDLNDMHEAENVLINTDDNGRRYEEELCKLTNNHCMHIWHATAAQRAEAFLRTLNLWID